jgi:hypothetical protein
MPSASAVLVLLGRLHQPSVSGAATVLQVKLKEGDIHVISLPPSRERCVLTSYILCTPPATIAWVRSESVICVTCVEV